MKKSRLMVTGSIIGLAMFAALPAYAQDAGSSDEQEAADDEEKAEEGNATILVTGSRVRRDTFNSASPIQVITR